MTNIEAYLAAIAGEYEGELPPPYTNIEKYLATLAGWVGELPEEAYTIVEGLLRTIIEHGAGGGDITVTTLNATENKTYNAGIGHAYNPVNVNVPIPDPPSGTIDIVENGQVDVSAYAEANVAVPIPDPPSGTISITENGTVDVSNYASASVAVPQGIPIEISTAVGMEAVLIAANVGKAYKYTGTTTDDYTQGDIYIVEEGA